MKLKPVVSQVVLGMGLVVLVTTVAEAQATRTWVSGVGDDANPCSRTAPCKTFAGAISKTAPNGYIDVLDPGGFGAVTITKSITIDGGGSLAGVVASLTPAIIINASTGINVTLRNLDLEGGGTGTIGINVVNAATVRVEHCNIVDFTGAGINFAPSAGATLFVSDTTVSKTTGIYVGNGRAFFDNLQADANTKGVFVNASAIVTVKNSYVGNGGEGFKTFAASAVLNVVDSVSTNNQYGVDATGGGTIRLSNTAILSNVVAGMFNDGTSFIVSMGGNSLEGPALGAFTSTDAKQ